MKNWKHQLLFLKKNDNCYIVETQPTTTEAVAFHNIKIQIGICPCICVSYMLIDNDNIPQELHVLQKIDGIVYHPQIHFAFIFEEKNINNSNNINIFIDNIKKRVQRQRQINQIYKIMKFGKAQTAYGIDDYWNGQIKKYPFVEIVNPLKYIVNCIISDSKIKGIFPVEIGDLIIKYITSYSNIIKYPMTLQQMSLYPNLVWNIEERIKKNNPEFIY